MWQGIGMAGINTKPDSNAGQRPICNDEGTSPGIEQVQHFDLPVIDDPPRFNDHRAHAHFGAQENDLIRRCTRETLLPHLLEAGRPVGVLSIN
jgi:hypothetical protein